MLPLTAIPSPGRTLEALDREAGECVRHGRFADAVGLLEEAIALAPGIAALHSNLGFVLTQLGRVDEAVERYTRALRLKPDLVDAEFSRAILLERLGRAGEALAGFERVLALKPAHVGAHLGQGNALQALQRFEDALASYDCAIAIAPSNPVAHFNRGNALRALGRSAGALSAFDRALQIDPTMAPALNNRAGVLSGLGRHEDALAGFEAALALSPNNPEYLTNRGNTLNELKRHDEALACHSAAIAQAPDFAKAHVNRGIAFFDAGRLDEAIADYDRAIALDPALADAHYGRAIALAQRKHLAEALASYERAYALNLRLPFLFGKLLHHKAAVCDWSGRDTDVAELARRIGQGESVSPPFPVLSLIDAPDVHGKAAALYARERATLPDVVAVAPYRTHNRIRLGYFSADFHDHATAVLVAEMFERHDKSRFELFAFSFGPDTQDPMRYRLRGAFDHFFDVRLLSDASVAALARRHEIDIAIDLKGYTGEARPGIFAHRTAPVQVNYLGYPGTLGASWCDYIIADSVLIPASDREHYVEKVVVLPDTYQPNAPRPVTETPSRAAAGLPEEGFVFCCFNNVYKIAPETFRSWMRILARVDKSVLWLLDENPLARENLRKTAAHAGIAPERLIFAARVSLADHLARHRHADLFLDTLPYNAHTTASDALWMGLPILTLRGRSFAGRVSASLLTAVGLPELITESADAYEAAALSLARDPERLSALKRKLVERRDIAPLFDMARFTRHIEDAFSAMHAWNQAGEVPDHIALGR